MQKKTLAQGAAALVAVGTVASISLVGGSANADPQHLNAFVGVGSDTTQDVLNALSGYAPAGSGVAAAGRYLPAIASTGEQLMSFDATNPDPFSTDPCIVTTQGGPAFDRPNGSSNGRRALSRAQDGTGWGSAACGGLSDLSGQVDFARSSSGPSSGDTGTDLTYSVLGQDAVSVAFYVQGVASNTIDPVTSTSSQVKSRWTQAELNAIFQTGQTTLLADDGTTSIEVLPCGIQTGSGTFSFTRGVYGVSETQENTATAACNALGGLGRAQENDSTELKDRGDLAPAGTQVIIGFSAGAYIAKSNGVASPDPQADGVGLAAITDNGAGTNLGLPYGGSAPSLVPESSFYADGTFGRDVYNVVPTVLIDSPFGNDGIKDMFKDPDGAGPGRAAICDESDTIAKFGFLAATNCGDTSLKGSFRSGQANS